jgi:hypothetical protein
MNVYKSLFLTIFVLFQVSLAGQITPDISEQTSKKGILEFAGGLHFGAFDCNQTNKYPINVGVLFMSHYQKANSPWFFGGEVGVAKVNGSEEENNYGRTTSMYIGNITLLGGYNFGSLKLAVGIPYYTPISVSSEGTGFVEPSGGVGVAGYGFYKLPNRLSLFGSMSRIGKDLDGFGNINEDLRASGNTEQATYIYKLGFLWNFIPSKR